MKKLSTALIVLGILAIPATAISLVVFRECFAANPVFLTVAEQATDQAIQLNGLTTAACSTGLGFWMKILDGMRNYAHTGSFR